MVATRTLLSSVVLVGLTAVLAGQAPALDVKLGLWENTVVTNMGGAPPIDTSKMSPEQAAQMAAAMKGMMGERTMTEKSCVTKEDLAKDSFMLPQESGMKCARTITTNTRTAYVADVSCTGQGEMKGQISIESTGGGTAFTGSMKMATSAPGRTMNITMKMSGKYLGAECGNVK
jgi:Protein of unknown function (DUF3617)